MSTYSAGSASVQIVPDFSGAQRKIGLWFAQQGDMKVNVQPDLDNLAMARVDAEVARHRPTLHINIDHTTLAKDFVAAIDFVTGTSMVGKAMAALFDVKSILLTNVGGAGVAIAGVLSQATTGLAAMLPSLVSAAVIPIGTIALGLQGIGDAFSNMGDPKKFAEAMSKLAPAARDFVTEIHSMAPAFNDLKLDVQQHLFEGLGESLHTLGDKMFPMLQGHLTGIADEINFIGRSLAETLGTDSNVADFAHTIDNVKVALHEAGLAVAPLWGAFADLATVGSDFLPGLVKGFGDLATRFANFIQTARDSGQLANFIGTALSTVSDLITLIGNLGSILGSAFKAGMQSGHDLVGILKALTGDVADFMRTVEAQSSLGSFFSNLTDAFQALAPAVADFVEALVIGVLPAMSGLASAVAPVLAGVLTQFADLLKELGPLFYPALASAIASALSALAPLIDVFGEISRTVLPVVIDAIKRLAPLFSDLAESIGESLVKAVDNLAPLLHKVVDAFEAIAKSLVPMIKNIFAFGASILPPVVAVLGALLEVLKFIAPLLPTILTGFVAFKAIGAISVLVGTFGTKLLSAAVAAETLGKKTGALSMGRLSNGLMGAAGGAERFAAAMGPLAIGAAIVGGAVMLIANEARKAKEHITEMAKGFANMQLAADNGGTSGQEAARKLAASRKEMADLQAQLDAPGGDPLITGKFGSLHVKADDIARLNELKDSLAQSTREYRDLLKELGPVGVAQAAVTQATNDYNEAVANGTPKEVADALTHLQTAQAQLGIETTKANDATKTQLQLMQEARDKILEAANVQLAYENSQARAAEGIKAYNDEMAKGGEWTDERAQKERDLRQTLIESAAAAGAKAEQDNAALGPVAAARAGIEAQIQALKNFSSQLDGPAKVSMDALIASLEANSTAAGWNKAKMEELGLAVIGVPGEKTVEISAPTATQEAALERLGYHVEHLPNGQVFVTLEDADAKAKMDAFVNQKRSIGVQVNYIPGVGLHVKGGTILEAAGGIVKAFAQGGFMQGGIAQVVKPNTWRIIGDRVTDDEAYIPINGDPRSQQILGTTAEAMGFTLVPNAAGNYWTPPGMSSVFGRSSDPMAAAGLRDAAGRSRKVGIGTGSPTTVAGFVNNGTVMTTDLDELSRKSRLGTQRALAVAGL